MRTIVVPTDFSSSAEHAGLYAAQLAKALNASILLLHVYQMPVTMSDFPVLIVSSEELKKNADEALKKVKAALQQTLPGVPVETESRLGDLIDEIKEVCEKREVIALVAGTKDLSGFERLLLGNTTLSIIRHCSFPVIAVPEGAEIKLPLKLALAVDLLNVEEIPVAKILDLVSRLHAELHLVHVEMKDEHFSENDLPVELKGARFHSLKETDITQGIQQFVQLNNIDLLAVLPHKHNLYERLFFKGHTTELVTAMPVPVLCIRN